MNIDLNTHSVFFPGVAWLLIPRTSLNAHWGWLNFQSWHLFVVLRPQSVISTDFQTVHAREPQVSNGGVY